MTRFITLMGDNGHFGVWNVEAEKWRVSPSHTMENAEMMAALLEHQEKKKQAYREKMRTNVGVLGLVAHKAVMDALPLRFSYRLHSHCAEIILRERYRN